jgi:hypothetical protein
MLSFPIFRGVVAGMAAGFASGLLSVTPGGILVPGLSMLLPCSQHVNCVSNCALLFRALVERERDLLRAHFVGPALDDHVCAAHGYAGGN